MISITKASKFLTVCQSCAQDTKPTWSVTVTTKLDDRSSQSIVVALCLKCLHALGLRAVKIAMQNQGDQTDDTK